MNGYVVSRMTGRFTKDYLVGWDLIWGPVWSLSSVNALRFGRALTAQIAADDAVAIMKPVTWRVPDFGGCSTVQVDCA